MAEADQSIENLLAARALLKNSLENSKATVSALDKFGPRLEEINQRLPSLEAAIKQRCIFTSFMDHIDGAIGPASAVLKVFDSVCELEKSLLSDPFSDLLTYLSVVKRLEEALKFLTDSCSLAVQWLEDIVEFLEDNSMADDRYILKVKMSLKFLEDLQAVGVRARLNGGFLSSAFEKLEIEFKRLLEDEGIPLALSCLSSSTAVEAYAGPFPQVIILQKLQVIVERLNANNRLKNCISIYVEIRSSSAGRALQVLDVDYLEKPITEFDDVQDIKGYIDQWSKHFELAVKHVFQLEYRLCKEVFRRAGSDVWWGCFAKIASQSGILSLLQFGMSITECKKDPIKLLKLLEVFAMLDNLRLDFNRIFCGEACSEIQTLTRNLIKRVVNGASEIFWELSFQVEQQRQSSPPSDGSVPMLVSFVTDYCNQLLSCKYRPILTQVLEIHQSWKHEKYQEGLVTNQVYNILKEIALNLDAWSKAYYHDITLSYLFTMNNHFHFCNLRGTELGTMMGDSWLRAHEEYKDYYAELYLRELGKASGSFETKGRDSCL